MYKITNVIAIQRAIFAEIEQSLGDCEGIHWPQVDEDISVTGLLADQPSVEASAAFA